MRTEVSGGGMYSGMSASEGSFRLETLATSLDPIAINLSSNMYSPQSLVGTAISITELRKGGETLVGVILWVPEVGARGKRLANLTSCCCREEALEELRADDDEDDLEYELARGPLATPGRALDKPDAREKELPRPEDEEDDLDKAGPVLLLTACPFTSKYWRQLACWMMSLLKVMEASLRSTTFLMESQW